MACQVDDCSTVQAAGMIAALSGAPSLLLGNSGIMPAATERAKQPSSMGARPGGPSFGDFKISEESEERL